MRFTLLSVFIFFFSFQLAQSETNGLNSWTLTYSNSGRIFGMVIDPSNQNIMYEVGLDSGVYKTTNAGVSWFPVNNGLTYKGAFCIAIAPSNPNVLYVGTDQNGATSSGIYVSTNAGASWTLSNSGIVETSLGIQQIVVHPTNPAIAFMCLFDGLVGSTVGLYKTTNTGANWLADTVGLTQKNILSLLINPMNPNIIYAGSSYNPASVTPTNIFKSYNGGATWNNISNGLPTGTTTGDPVRALSISTLDTSIVLAALFTNDTLGGAYLTTNGGQLWVKKSSGLVPFNTTGYLLRACAIKPGTSNEFYVGLDNSTVTTARGVWRTTNGGNTWVDFNSEQMVNSYPVRSLVFKTTGNPTLYAGAANTTMPGRGVYEYSWQGTTGVTNRSLLLPTPGVNTNYVVIPFNAGMVGFGNSITIEAWINPGGSTTANTILNKGGVSFDYQLGISATTMLPFFRAQAMIATSPFSVPVGVWSHLAAVSDGSTVTFYLNGVAGAPVALATVLGSSVNEMRIGRGNSDAGSGKIDELRLWGVARTPTQISANMCIKWIPINTTGLKALWHLDSTFVDSVNGWHGSAVGNVTFDTANNCMVTGIINTQTEVVKDFQLYQNYPNPFNPVTKIKFSIPKSAYVEMKIFDISGREVATLVSDPYLAGTYEVDFSGSKLSSGVYFYRITAGEFRDTKKMILIK